MVRPLTAHEVMRSHVEAVESADLLGRCRRLATEQAALLGALGPVSAVQPGEDVASSEVGDADHWVAVYSELVEFKCDLLREFDRQARAMGEDAVGLVSPNRRVFALELRRLQLHLEYWLGRRDELRAGSVRR